MICPSRPSQEGREFKVQQGIRHIQPMYSRPSQEGREFKGCIACLTTNKTCRPSQEGREFKGLFFR